MSPLLLICYSSCGLDLRRQDLAVDSRDPEALPSQTGVSAAVADTEARRLRLLLSQSVLV